MKTRFEVTTQLEHLRTECALTQTIEAKTWVAALEWVLQVDNPEHQKAYEALLDVLRMNIHTPDAPAGLAIKLALFRLE